MLVNELPDADEATLIEWRDRAIEERMSVDGLKTAIDEERSRHTPATLEKSFIVKVPISLWEMLKDFSDYERLPIREIARRWLVTHSESVEIQLGQGEARLGIKERRKEARRKQGKRLARNFPLPQNR